MRWVAGLSAPPIRKVYVERPVGGGTTEYWEELWEGDEHGKPAVPLSDLLRRHVPKHGRVLEAGCGSAGVLLSLRQLGCPAVGVDLAERALHVAKRECDALPLAVGDVQRLPFGDGTFDCIVSLGVVEHFEGGPHAALVEHRRALKPGGQLLITVPRISTLKRWNDWRNLVLGRRSYRRRSRIVTRVHDLRPTPTDWTFHQYEFPRRVFRQLLLDAGFRVTRITPYLVSAGLGESAFLESRARRRETHPTDDGPAAAGGGNSSVVRDAVLHERGAGLLGRTVTGVARHALAHMDMALAQSP